MMENNGYGNSKINFLKSTKNNTETNQLFIRLIDKKGKKPFGKEYADG